MVWQIYIIGFLLSLFGVLSWYIYRLKKEVHKKSQQLRTIETLYSSILLQAKEGILFTNLQGKIEDVNPGMCNLLGYTREELKGKPIEMLIEPEQLKVDPLNYELAHKGEAFHRSRKFQKKSGEIMHVEIVVQKLLDEKFMVLGRDVTELRHTHLQLALSENTLRNAFEFAAHGMALVSPEGKFLRTNIALRNMFGYSEEEMRQLNVRDITYTEDLPATSRYFREMESGETEQLRREKRYIRKNGDVIWANLNSSLIRDANGNPMYYISHLEDITEAKRMTQQLLHYNHQINERVKELKCLYTLSRFAHEPGKSLEAVLEESIAIIPQSYQFPEITVARITFGGQVYESKGFITTIWKQEAEIFSGEVTVGKVEIFYTEERPDSDEGPFLKEERYLINSVADIIGMFYDRKNSENDLRESEKKFRSLVENNLIGVYIIQGDRFIYVNNFFEQITGYSSTQLLEEYSFLDLIHDDDIPVIRENYTRWKNNIDAEKHYTIKIIRSDGDVRHIELMCIRIQYKGQPALIGSVIDITDRLEEQKRISRAVIDMQEQERQQIGMELHDNVQQILAANMLHLDMLKYYSEHQPDMTDEILNNIRTYTNEAITELRRLSHQLAPSIDSIMAFSEKISSLVNNLNVAGTIKITVDDELTISLSHTMQLALYRIIQEQLNNILKYSEASHARIHVQNNTEYIFLAIEDNGKGFDPRIKTEGIGLQNIKRRVQLLNGKYEIIAAPGKGCRIAIHIPNTISQKKSNRMLLLKGCGYVKALWL